MTISFSGLASGMDTSSWVEALVSVKQASITKLETQKQAVAATQEVLNNVKNFFDSFRGILESVTDARFGIPSLDLFSQNLAESSNTSILTAIASTSAENKTYDIVVNQLATQTEVESGIKTVTYDTAYDIATLDSKLFTLGDGTNPIQAGTITFNFDPTGANRADFNRTVTIDEESTIESFIEDLDSIGINASYDENTGSFAIDISTNQIVSDGTKVGGKGGLIAALQLTNVNYGYKTSALEIVSSLTVSTTATEDTKLKELLGYKEDYTGAELTAYNEKYSFTIKDKNGSVLATSTKGIVKKADNTTLGTLTPESTLSDLFNILGNFDIDATVSNGSIVITSDKDGAVFSGNLSDALTLDNNGDPYISLSKMFSTAIVKSTETRVVSRTSTLEQIGAIQRNADGNIITGTLIINDSVGNPLITISSATTAASTTTINQSSTVQDLFDILTEYGITGKIVDGVITLNSTNGNYISGNIATNIGILAPVVDTQYTTAPIKMTSTQSVKANATLASLGMSSDASMVIYSPLYGVVSVNIAKELTVQQFCDKINDSNYGIHAELKSNGKIEISELGGSGAYVKGISSVLQSALKLSVGEDLSYDTTTINVYANTESKFLEYADNNIEISGDTVISSIEGYNNGNGTLKLHKIGVGDITITVDPSLTLDEFINNTIVGLAQYGISGGVLSDGKVFLSADDDTYIQANSGGSNLLSVLKMSALQQTVSGEHIRETAPLTATVRSTTTVLATQDTQLSLFNQTTVAGGTTVTLSTEGSLVFKVNDYYKTVNLTENDTFETLIQKLKSQGINASLSKGVFVIESGYDDVEYLAEASSSKLGQLIGFGSKTDLGGYASSSVPIKSTVVSENELTLSVSKYADNATLVKDAYITAGSLTILRNGQKATINISESDTFGTLGAKFNEAFDTNDIVMQIDDSGHLVISSTTAGVNISIGSTSDSSNFTAITGLVNNADGTISSSRQMYKMNENTKVTSSDLYSAVDILGDVGGATTATEGYFIVGNAKIYIDSNTTISDIVSQINLSEDSLATAYWDNIDGKLVIKSKVTGASAVNIESGTTNFTDLMGLTRDGALVLDTQSLGTNARVTINGVTYTSLSNNITSDSTGIQGLTINLKNASESNVTLTVKRDSESLFNAVSNVIDAYNELLSNLETLTVRGGELANQSMLKIIKNNIRTAMMSSDIGTERFRNLAAIGITASAASGSNISTSNSAITQLSIDKDKFMEAYESYEEDVKALLVGSTNADGTVKNKGIFTKVEDIVEEAVASANGYFAVANNSYTKQIDTISKKIVSGTEALTRYRERLEQKFTSMDILIANMQTQYKAFT